MREVVVLGTASMAPTRARAHNSVAVRWDDQLILFDPGEGTQRGCILGGVSIAKATAICITHFHGDHCLGLPGVIQRRSHESASGPSPLAELPIVHPADGRPYLERLRTASIFHDASNIVPVGVEAAGDVLELGDHTLRAEPLEHRDTTFGYRIDEPDGWTAVPARLAHYGIEGPAVGRLIRTGSIETPHGTVGREQVCDRRPGQSLAFVMDTVPCEGAERLADGVDLLIMESTYLHAEVDLARRYKHTTARQAGELAAAAGVRRLLLTHFSARYPDSAVFAEEASAYHSDVVAADELAAIAVPPRRRSS